MFTTIDSRLRLVKRRNRWSQLRSLVATDFSLAIGLAVRVLDTAPRLDVGYTTVGIVDLPLAPALATSNYTVSVASKLGVHYTRVLPATFARASWTSRLIDGGFWWSEILFAWKFERIYFAGHHFVVSGEVLLVKRQGVIGHLDRASASSRNTSSAQCVVRASAGRINSTRSQAPHPHSKQRAH